MRRLALSALLLVLAVPVAGANMEVTPSRLTIAAGQYTHLRVELENPGRGTFAWAFETEGHGLLVSLDEDAGKLGPGASVALTATVRAPPWASGEYDVHLLLHEDGELVEDHVVHVHVTPLFGLPEPAARAALGAAVGGVVGGSLAGLVGWRRWHLVAAALYTRLHRDQIERHPSRALLVDIVRRRPGVSLADAQRESGLANGPFEHHLDKLRRSGRVLVVEQGRGRFLRLPESAPLDPSLDTSAAVAGLVRARGKVKAAEVARALGLSRQALHYHVRKLAGQGLLDARIEGGRLVLSSRGLP